MIEALRAAISAGDHEARLILADLLEDQGNLADATVQRLAFLFIKEGPFSWTGAALKFAGHHQDSPSEARGLTAYPKTTWPVANVDVEAAKWLTWLQENRLVLEKATSKILRKQLAKEAAAKGDVKALLSIKSARDILVTMIKGGKPRRVSITDWTRSRKAIAAAKAIMMEREQRRSSRQQAEAARLGKPGRYAARWIAKLKARAIALAKAYHYETASLYRSSRATVVYGRGGQEEHDDEAYSKAYCRRFGGARWKNAGARLDNETRPTCVIIENYRGTEVARIPLEF